MMKCRLRESRLIAINEGERSLTAADVSAVYQINGDETKHSALDRMLENVLPIRFAEVVEREVLLGNVSRIKKCCHKNVIPRLHFRVAGYFLVDAERAF